MLKKYGYAVVGATNFAMNKTKDLAGRTWGFVTRTGRKDTMQVYQNMVERGEDLVSRIRRSAPAKRAANQTKVARSQVKAAVTSVRKAVGAQGEAVKASAKKVS